MILLLFTKVNAQDRYVVTMILHSSQGNSDVFLINNLSAPSFKENIPVTAVWKTPLSRHFFKELYEKGALRKNPCFSWIIAPSMKKQSLILVRPFVSSYPLLIPSFENHFFSTTQTFYRRMTPWSGIRCGYMDYWKLSDWRINIDLETTLEGTLVKFTEKLNVNEWTIIDNPSISALIRVMPLVSNN